MKAIMKGKLLKKLKSIRPVGHLRQDRVLQVNASDGYVDSNPTLKAQTQLICEETEQNQIVQTGLTVQEPDIIDVAELMRDLEDEDVDFDTEIDNKENIGPPMETKEKSEPDFRENRALEASEVEHGNCRQKPLSEIDISSFRRPDLNSGTLFDPNLLAAFEQAVKEHIRMNEAERIARIEQENLENIAEATEKEQEQEEVEEEPPSKARRVEEDENPLLSFEEKCPPGGTDSVIFYTTTLRGIRKTFEDCNSIRFLLESFRVVFYERDVSMHTEFKEELWRILDSKAAPPRLFIKGRYIGGAEAVLVLHEQGKFRPLFEGVPIDRSNGACEGCAGVRFVVCSNCSGSHKILSNEGESNMCPECNENGLIICPICC
jgi:glutaredoxin domain-containing cysteine-rich protein 1